MIRASKTVSITVAAWLLLASVAWSQISGFPGDGIPDIYYSQFGGTVQTSIGPISLPAGWLTVDTDGSDMVTILIGGALDVATVGPTDGVTPGCDLCNNGSLPDPNNPPFNFSSWTTGFINGSNQWVRTAPLTTTGYQGVIGQDPDPFDIFPDTGLAFYGSNPQFDAVFDDGSGQLWEVVFATFDSGTIYTNVSGFFPPPNIPPVAEDDEYTVTIGGTIDTLLDGLPGLLDNDFDPDGGPLGLSAFGPDSGPDHGTVTIALDGSFVYTHDGLSLETDTFTYIVDDGLDFDIGTVTINVVPEPATMIWMALGMLLLRLPTHKHP
jgi:hypothetical protein